MRSFLVRLWLAALPAIGLAAPSITNLGPNPINAAYPVYFLLTINGSGFVNGSIAHWGSTILSTTFLNSNALQAAITPDLRQISDNYPITVVNPDLSVSNTFAMIVSPVLSSVTPRAVIAGNAVNITVAGSGFQSGLQVQLSSTAGLANYPATINDPESLTAVIPASALAVPQTALIRIVNTKADPSGGNASYWLPFEIHNLPSISSASPNPIDAGGGSFTLTVTGTGFSPGSVVNWGGSSALVTTYVSPTELQAAITPDLRVSSGAFNLTASDPATGATSNSSAEVVSPVLFSIGPTSAPAGSAAVTITATGTGLTPATAISMSVAGQQTTLPTTYGNATTLSAILPAGALRATGNVVIQLVDSAGGGRSLAQTFTVVSAPAAVITSLAPSTATAGAATFTMTVVGSGFASGATVLWNGSPLATTFVSATQLAATVPTALVQAAGTANVAAANPGGATSASLGFTINAPPTISSVSPVSAIAGTASFILTVNGSNFAAGSVLQWNGAPLAGNLVSATQITATVPANLIAQAGTASIRVVSAAGAPSTSASFVISPAAPVLTTIAPGSITAGSASATLTVNGTNFAAGATVQWNGSSLTTTFVSSVQVTATLPGSLFAGLLSGVVTVTNPGGAVSNGLTVKIDAPRPTIALLSPPAIAAGAGPVTLLVNGQNFAVNCVVRWNGAPLYTTLASATQATAAVPADLVAAPGQAAITLANPSGLESNAVALAITTPIPGIYGITPASAAAGAAGLTLTISGSNFLAASKALWNGSPLVTTFVSTSQLKADIPATLLAAPAMASVTVSTPGVPPSNAALFTVGSPVPATSTAAIVNAASSAPAIAPGSLISIYGLNLAPGNAAPASMPLPTVLNGTAVSINGIAAPLIFVSPGQINAQVPFEVQPGNATLLIQAGQLQSSPVTFNVQPVAPGVLPVVQNAADGTVNSQQTPAQPGQYVTVYVTGQGTVDPPVPTGAAAPSDLFALPLATVQAQIGGQDATITFAGLAPGLAGLMQVNLLLPAVPPGDQPLILTVGGVPSNAVTVSVGAAQ